jgi:hypothetical protein
METWKPRRRPTGITVVAVLYEIAAPLLFFFGSLFLALSAVGGGYSNAGFSLDKVLFAYFTLVSVVIFPFVPAIVAAGLLQGRKWTRIGTIALCIVNLAYVFYLYARGYAYRFLPYLVGLPFDLIIQVAIICYMFTSVARSYLR